MAFRLELYPARVVCSQASFVEPVPIPRSLSVTWMPGSQVVGWRMHHRHWLASSGALTAFLPSTLDMFAEFILYVAGSYLSDGSVFGASGLAGSYSSPPLSLADGLCTSVVVSGYTFACLVCDGCVLGLSLRYGRLRMMCCVQPGVCVVGAVA